MKQAPFGRWDAVTFDASGTLIEPWPSVGHVYATAAAEQRLGEFAPAVLNRRFFAAWEQTSGFEHTKAAWLAVVRKTFTGIVPAAVVPELFEAIYLRFASGSSWRIADDAKPCLETLKSAGVQMAVVSNFDERLGPLLSELGLASYFQVVIASGLLGVHKPDARVFLEAATRLGVAPGRVLHVGDSPREDLEGARSAGFGAVLIDRGGKRRDLGALGSLVELPGWMAGATAPSAD